MTIALFKEHKKITEWFDEKENDLKSYALAFRVIRAQLSRTLKGEFEVVC